MLDISTRGARKSIVFHVMYGTWVNASEEEMQEWRLLCGKFIDNGGDLPPLTLDTFRKWKDTHA